MIELVNIQNKHEDSLVRMLNNKNVSRWLTSIPYPYTESDASSFIEKCRSDYSEKHKAFAIEVDGTHVGGIGLHLINAHSAEIGFWLGEEFWGRGYMSAAMNILLEDAFNNPKLMRISALVFDGNESSERLLKRCGFEQEGFCRKLIFKDGEFKNCKLYSKVK